MYYIIYDHDWQPLEETAPSHSQKEMAGGGRFHWLEVNGGMAIIEATERRGEKIETDPGRIGSGAFVLNAWGSVYSVYNFLEFVEIILYIVVLLVFVHSK